MTHHITMAWAISGCFACLVQLEAMHLIRLLPTYVVLPGTGSRPLHSCTEVAGRDWRMAYINVFRTLNIFVFLKYGIMRLQEREMPSEKKRIEASCFCKFVHTPK